jgi:hypothetical protein
MQTLWNGVEKNVDINIEILIACSTIRRCELEYIDLKVNKRNPQCQNIAKITNAFLEA